MEWFKVFGRETVNDERLALLTDEEIGVWFRLMAICSLQKEPGTIRITVLKNVYGWNQIRMEILHNCLVKMGLITVADDLLRFQNFHKHQSNYYLYQRGKETKSRRRPNVDVAYNSRKNNEEVEVEVEVEEEVEVEVQKSQEGTKSPVLNKEQGVKKYVVGAEAKKTLASTPAAVPEELKGLELYSQDQALCKRWPDLFGKAWPEAYPAVDILAEVRKAHAWECSNPKYRKKNRVRFLNNWLSKEQDRARRNGGGSEKDKRGLKQNPGRAAEYEGIGESVDL